MGTIFINKNKNFSKMIFEEDMFDIKDIDKDGKMFEKVSRIECRSENYDTDLILDVNVDIYPLDIGDKFAFALASTLNLDQTVDDGFYTQSTHETIADKYKYEYVMHGKVFKCEPVKSRLAIYASFGGLLMKLEGDPRNLHEIQLDQRIYLLVRKVVSV